MVKAQIKKITSSGKQNVIEQMDKVNSKCNKLRLVEKQSTLEAMVKTLLPYSYQNNSRNVGWFLSSRILVLTMSRLHYLQV